MRAQIITIGDELLIGQVIDTNSAFIGKQLTKIGISVGLIKTIEDESHAILNALEEMEESVKLVMVTGGLGPTKDDKTKAAFCDFFEDELEENKEVLQHIRELLSHLKEPLLKDILGQAMLPSKAKILPNRYGTAAGMWFDKEDRVYISLPGVPYEMKALLMKEVIPRLVNRFDRPFILQRTVLTYGMGESRVAQKISKWEDALPAHFGLAYLPSPGQVRLRVTATGKNKSQLEEELHTRLQELEALLGPIIGGYEGEQNLQEKIATRLTQKGFTLSVAESCTGGKIASLFTDIPGASSFFVAGMVPYATSMKIEVLGVSKMVIDQHSVVSTETAKAMALACQRLFKTDFALATTGNAGPSKGDSDAEIGTVCIALASPEGVVSREFQFGKSRERVVKRSVIKALEMLQHRLGLDEKFKKNA